MRRGSRWWLGRDRPPARRWAKSCLIHCRGPWCKRCGQSVLSEGALLEGCPSCMESPPIADGLIRVASFKPTVAALIHAFKYQGWWELAQPLGQRLGDALRAEEGGGTMRAAVVVSSPIRVCQHLLGDRHHVGLLGDVVASAIGGIRRPALIRLWGARQTGRSASARHRMDGRGWLLHPRAKQWLKGQDVVFVDDVLTTGQTARVAVRLLRRAGARRVLVAVVAVTPKVASDLQKSTFSSRTG